MADIRNNPHFVLFPVNNNRTGYQPVALPVLYVEPRRIDEDGNGIADSESLRVRYYVVDAPDPARVNGPFNQNIRIPDEALFEVELTAIDLANKQLDLRGLRFFGSDGVEKSFIDAVEGDTFEYTMSGPISGSTPTSTAIYYPDVYYYDVSDVFIDPDELPKPKRYFFVWEAVFFRRLATATGDLKCISGEQGLAQLIFDINHPGDVHEHMFRLTPNLYFDFDNNTVQSDPTLKFYRPFADSLQDIFDEQGFLDGVNQIDTIPAEYIPYLAYLIGVDLPNFPGTTDSLRRSILRRGSELQKLKSSKRVLSELFEMFGFVVDIVNLQASLDGNSYLAPGDGLDTELLTQSDVVVSDFAAEGFGVGDVPFVFRPRRNSQIVLNAWLVQNGSQKYNELLALANSMSDDLESENVNGISVNVNGILEPSFVSSIGFSQSGGVVGYSNVVVGQSSSSKGRPVLNDTNISYNKTANTLSLFFDHELSVDRGTTLFVFATYERLKIIIPEELSNTRTNKFDVEFVSRQGLVVDFNLLQFLLDFVFNLKGFHSLLRKIKVPIEVVDVYNVTDTCVDGNDPFKEGTDLGDIQTPPAIIPNDVTCEDGNDRNFKPSDLALRALIFEGLEEEFQAWKALSPDDCALTPDGQDKVLSDYEICEGTDDDADAPDYDHELDTRETLCGDNPQKLDYCYKGRVQANLEELLVIPLRESWHCKPCGPGLGTVVYWEQEPNQAKLDGQNSGLLRNRITRRFGESSLHYTDQPFYEGLSNDTLAFTPAGLDIEKDNLGFPSHRFLGMGALENDYNYTDAAVAEGCFEESEAQMRPWDIDGCENPVDLNPRIIINTDGDEELVWNEMDLVYIGNGLLPDIPSLSDHDGVTDGRIITHKIYQTAPDSHPSLTFEGTIFTATESVDTATLETGAIFESTCSTTGEDFIGGYPASTGSVETTKTTFEDGDVSGDLYYFDDPTASTGLIDRAAIAEALCIASDDVTSSVSARFFGTSMEYIAPSNAEYRYYLPYRLDCACLNSSCGTDDPTGIDGVACNEGALYDSNGVLDPNCDKLDLDLVASLSEAMSLCDRITDNDLANLFCLNDDCNTPESGSFRYQDDYGIIYEVEWIFMEDTMDITVVTKDPRIPGEEDDGFVKFDDGNYRIFRKGIISTVRQIVKVLDDGSIYIDAEGSNIEIGYFQTNVSCSDEAFDSPFTYGIDCALQANAAALVTDGPHWVDPIDEPTSATFGFSVLAEVAPSKTIYYWGDPENPQPDDFYWIDPLESFAPVEIDSNSSSSSD